MSEFKVNDMIFYAGTGVCRITDIRPEKFGRDTRTYYVIQPLTDKKTTVYCPVDADKVRIRRVLSRDEVIELIRSIPDTDTGWITNDSERKERSEAALSSGDCAQLIRLMRSLYLHRSELAAAGRKLHATDERVLKDAEQKLYEEFSYVLDIKPDEVEDFISGIIGGNAD